MILRINTQWQIILVFLLLFFSCSEYQKILKSPDLDLKYHKAVKYYNEGDYYRAKSLLDELLPIYKGTQHAENVYYYYTYCLYGMGDYILAAYHFRKFVATYPNSIYNEECQFMSAYCYYLSSPKYNLDQTYTYRAIDRLQLFINLFPQSDSIPRCNKLIDNLRKKLELKSFYNAKLYYELGDYKAAIIALTNSLMDFPDTEFREDILFLILKSHYLLAKNSIQKKQKKRYNKTIEAYHNLIEKYPDTKYKREAKKIYEKSYNAININYQTKK